MPKDNKRPDHGIHDALVTMEVVVSQLLAFEAHGPYAASAR
jgi:hypothetical protein